jgi:hypothetical protein
VKAEQLGCICHDDFLQLYLIRRGERLAASGFGRAAAQ